MSFETPILLIVFNRPDKTLKLINALKDVKPKNVFVSADGPRDGVENDKHLCSEVRKLFDTIPWHCKITTKFNDQNLSCKKNVIESIDWFFEYNDQGVILEDDCIPSKSFFLFCEKLLEKYKNNQNIMQINGFNGGLEYQASNNDSYFFSKINTTWGWATWKRAWLKFDNSFLDYPEMVKKNKIVDYYENHEIAKWMERYFVKSINNDDNIWSTNWSYTILKNNGLCISPISNLVKNIGFDESATSGKVKLFSRFSIEFNDNFKLDKFLDKITYNKYNDEKQFYDLIKKIDPRAKKKKYYRNN